MDNCRTCLPNGSVHRWQGPGQDSIARSRLRALQIALVLLSVFFVLELTAALVSHSLSLLAESAHVCSDIAALVISLLAHRCARSWRAASMPLGLTPLRIEAGAALINGLGLMAIALGVGGEALSRLHLSQTHLQGMPMVVTASVGIVVHSCNAFWLHPCSHDNLNVRGAFLHSLADILTSLGVLVAAVAVSWLHWTWMDGVVSLLVSGLILSLAVPLLLHSAQQFYTPPAADDAGECPCDRPLGEKLLFPTLQECLK